MASMGAYEVERQSDIHVIWKKMHVMHPLGFKTGAESSGENVRTGLNSHRN
jgi:hypothetical protein